MKNKIAIIASLLFSVTLIASAVFLSSASAVKADDSWGEEVCRATGTDTNPANGCSCTSYTCVQYGFWTREGEKCSNGSGWDTKVNKYWGDYNGCRGIKGDDMPQND